MHPAVSARIVRCRDQARELTTFAIRRGPRGSLWACHPTSTMAPSTWLRDDLVWL